MKIEHFILGHDWIEIDIFEFGKSNYVELSESNFRYYKCSCGKKIREHSQKIMQKSI